MIKRACIFIIIFILCILTSGNSCHASSDYIAPLEMRVAVRDQWLIQTPISDDRNQAGIVFYANINHGNFKQINIYNNSYFDIIYEDIEDFYKLTDEEIYNALEIYPTTDGYYVWSDYVDRNMFNYDRINRISTVKVEGAKFAVLEEQFMYSDIDDYNDAMYIHRLTAVTRYNNQTIFITYDTMHNLITDHDREVFNEFLHSIHFDNRLGLVYRVLESNILLYGAAVASFLTICHVIILICLKKRRYKSRIRQNYIIKSKFEKGENTHTDTYVHKKSDAGICSHCLTTLNNGQSFCPECGKKIYL